MLVSSYIFCQMEILLYSLGKYCSILWWNTNDIRRVGNNPSLFILIGKAMERWTSPGGWSKRRVAHSKWNCDASLNQLSELLSPGWNILFPKSFHEACLDIYFPSSSFLVLISIHCCSFQSFVEWLAPQQLKAQNLRAYTSLKLQLCPQTNPW